MNHATHIIHFDNQLNVGFWTHWGGGTFVNLSLENVTNYCLAPLQFRCNLVVSAKDEKDLFKNTIAPMLKWIAEDENLIGLWALDMEYESDTFDVEKTFHCHFSFSNIADMLMFKFKFG